MFSGILEDDHSYPEFMEVVQKTYHKLVEVVEICQKGKVLSSGPLEESAIAVWSLVHGFVSLYLEQQLPGRVLEKYQLKKLLINTLLQLNSGSNTKFYNWNSDEAKSYTPHGYNEFERSVFYG